MLYGKTEYGGKDAPRLGFKNQDTQLIWIQHLHGQLLHFFGRN
jgi:hypothetical protein